MSIWLTGLLAVGLLGAPDVCPKQLGQVRWGDISHSFKVGAKRVEIRASVWDRKTNGKLGPGDLMRVESANVNGTDVGVSEVWVVVKGGLSKSLARTVKRNSDAVTSQCESRFEVKGVPKISSPAALLRHLKQVSGAGEVIDPLEDARSDMNVWAESICAKSKGHLDSDKLSKKLFSKARKRHRRVRKGTLLDLANEVAGQYVTACARLDQGTLEH